MGRKLRLAALLGLLLGAGCAQAGDFWDKLWRSADQRGEQLLRQGDPAAAAHTFADPQRKAYAELQAGDYPAAARDFAAFDSSDAHYNRGNALAHGGDLAAALKAYDAALARDPNNRDARHNRDLVAQALKQSKPPASSSQDQNSKQNPSKGSGESSDKDSTSKGSDKGSNKGSQKGSDQGSGKESDKGAATSGQPSGDKQGQQQQAGKPGSSAGEQGKGSAQAARQNPASAGNGNNEPRQTTGDEAEQARRDAEASLGQHASGQTGAGEGELADKAKRPGQPDAQRSEQQLAQEQWLRQIPDDPGGLLRRKFLIEHLMRQQGNQP
jgi:Ca-activated chloride channel homolog